MILVQAQIAIPSSTSLKRHLFIELPRLPLSWYQLLFDPPHAPGCVPFLPTQGLGLEGQGISKPIEVVAGRHRAGLGLSTSGISEVSEALRGSRIITIAAALSQHSCSRHFR